MAWAHSLVGGGYAWKPKVAASSLAAKFVQR